MSTALFYHLVPRYFPGRVISLLRLLVAHCAGIANLLDEPLGADFTTGHFSKPL
jgi:hypothetical protein